jgi:tetratricopeptide (TPR) repeat protein
MATIPEALAIALQHHQAGRLPAAEQIYRQILDAEPDHAEALNLLGVVQAQAGRHQLAVEYISRALAVKRQWPEVQSNLGNALWQLGRQDEAAAALRSAVALKPDYALGFYNLGNVLRDLAYRGKAPFDEAIACFRRAVELQPDFAEAHNNLGSVLKDRADRSEAMLAEAVECFRQAVAAKPGYAEAHSNLGSALHEQGKLDEAARSHRQAIACWERLLPSAPLAELHGNLGKEFGQLATILRGRLPDDDLTAMRRLLSAPDLGDGRIALEFGLARVLDASGRFGEAAEHLRTANTLRRDDLARRGRAYDRTEHRTLVEALISTCTPGWFANLKGSGLETELPVFIVGLSRSGTTLTEQILASHSRFFGGGELKYCEDTFKSLPEAMHCNDPPLECLSRLDRATVRELARRHAARLQALEPAALRAVDKMPENYLFLGLIGVLFPRARLIHCRRDLRDVALSCWMTNFATITWACDQDDIVSRFEAYRRIMDHWRSALPLPVLDVDYEQLVEEPEATARRIVAWCGLEWEPGCVKFHETQRSIRTASGAQVRRPIYKSSVGRWRNYEKWLGDLFARVERLL